MEDTRLQNERLIQLVFMHLGSGPDEKPSANVQEEIIYRKETGSILKKSEPTLRSLPPPRRRQGGSPAMCSDPPHRNDDARIISELPVAPPPPSSSLPMRCRSDVGYLARDEKGVRSSGPFTRYRSAKIVNHPSSPRYVVYQLLRNVSSEKSSSSISSNPLSPRSR